MNDYFIVEKGIPESVPNCNTVEELRDYLNKIPYPNHRLAGVQFVNGNFVLVWERKRRQEGGHHA